MVQKLPINEKYSLSFEEAAAYTGIGDKKLRQMVKANPNANWHFGSMGKTRIKRKLFEEYLDNINKL